MISCHPKIQNEKIPNSDLLKASWLKYKVERIDSIKNVYLIYARNDSDLYKILSHKQDSLADCRNITVGKNFTFHLFSLFPKSINGHDMTIAHLHVNGVSYFGTSVAKEKGCVDDLFFAENIHGLCY
jgi:hypothetical protein